MRSKLLRNGIGLNGRNRDGKWKKVRKWDGMGKAGRGREKEGERVVYVGKKTNIFGRKAFFLELSVFFYVTYSLRYQLFNNVYNTTFI